MIKSIVWSIFPNNFTSVDVTNVKECPFRFYNSITRILAMLKKQHALHIVPLKFMQYLLFVCISLEGKLKNIDII